MEVSQVKLPSNVKFGVFFSIVFGLLACYFIWLDLNKIAVAFIVLSVCFAVASYIRPELLLPLNKLWMRLGALLGVIVSPIIISFLFFFLITPIAIVMRIFGRDELRLKRRSRVSYWRGKDSIELTPESFKQQF